MPHELLDSVLTAGEHTDSATVRVGLDLPLPGHPNYRTFEAKTYDFSRGMKPTVGNLSALERSAGYSTPAAIFNPIIFITGC